MKEFVRLDTVKEGDILIATGLFQCIDEGQVCRVKAWPDGQLYVDCRAGPSHKHGLTKNADGFINGFYTIGRPRG